MRGIVRLTALFMLLAFATSFAASHSKGTHPKKAHRSQTRQVSQNKRASQRKQAPQHKQAPIAARPEFWVSGVKITLANAGDVLGDGSVEFDFEANELMLNNAKLQQLSSCPNGTRSVICSTSDLFTITLTGQNTISAQGKTGIKSFEGILKFEGDGSLEINNANEGIVSAGDIFIRGGSITVDASGENAVYTSSNLNISDGELTTSGANYGLYVDGYVFLTQGNLDIEGETASMSAGRVDLYNLVSITYSHDNKIFETALNWRNALMKAKHLKLAKQSLLYVGGTQVTPQNASDVLGDGGVNFDYEDTTLTLNSVYLFDGESGIYSTYNNLKIVLNGENSITNRNFEHGIYSQGSVTLSGSGSLEVFSNEGNIVADKDIVIDGNLNMALTGVIESAKGTVQINSGIVKVSTENSEGISALRVVINGGTIDLKTPCSRGATMSGYGIYAMESVTLNGGSLNVNAGRYGIFAGDNDVTLNGGNVLAYGENAAIVKNGFADFEPAELVIREHLDPFILSGTDEMSASRVDTEKPPVRIPSGSKYLKIFTGITPEPDAELSQEPATELSPEPDDEGDQFNDSYEPDEAPVEEPLPSSRNTIIL
ncbi:MAG: carbohydrate-binding domain-containing protein [Fibrobacter sp.]|nr:carbohydrate-binding domain-containing protein [Fibrobacter sp.]